MRDSSFVATLIMDEKLSPEDTGQLVYEVFKFDVCCPNSSLSTRFYDLVAFTSVSFSAQSDINFFI